MNIDTIRQLSLASDIAYNPSCANALDMAFNKNGYINDVETGFKACFLKANQNDLILACAGTEDLNDALHDLNYGISQFNKHKTIIIHHIIKHKKLYPDSTIYFTGHSLGGALAQYFAYNYSLLDNNIKLATFNSLGGKFGLLSNDDNFKYDDNVASQIDAAHIFLQNDIVATLGEGHVGGNTYTIKSDLGMLPSHSMKNMISALNLPLIQKSPAYAPTKQMQFFNQGLIQPFSLIATSYVTGHIFKAYDKLKNILFKVEHSHSKYQKHIFNISNENTDISHKKSESYNNTPEKISDTARQITVNTQKITVAASVALLTGASFGAVDLSHIGHVTGIGWLCLADLWFSSYLRKCTDNQEHFPEQTIASNAVAMATYTLSTTFERL